MKVTPLHPGVHILNQKKPPVTVFCIIVDPDDPTRIGVLPGPGIEQASRAAVASALKNLFTAMMTPDAPSRPPAVELPAPATTFRVDDQPLLDLGPSNGPVTAPPDQGEDTRPYE